MSEKYHTFFFSVLVLIYSLITKCFSYKGTVFQSHWQFIIFTTFPLELFWQYPYYLPVYLNVVFCKNALPLVCSHLMWKSKASFYHLIFLKKSFWQFSHVPIACDLSMYADIFLSMLIKPLYGLPLRIYIWVQACLWSFKDKQYLKRLLNKPLGCNFKENGSHFAFF